MSAPAVTVVIACFNYADWLPESVGSVLGQTFTDFELLIVDDGSTDDSLAVAQHLAAGDARVSVIAQRGSGQPAIPRNAGIACARGRYVVSLDADDKLGPTVLQLSAAVLDADPDAGLAFAQQQDFGDSDMLHPHLDWRLDRLKRFNYLPSATMFRRAAWEAAGGYSTNVRGYEDWDLWLGIAEAGFRGRPVSGAVWHYRRHERGVYRESKGSDSRLKAQVVVNRSELFGDGVLEWARGVLTDDPAALAVPHQLGVTPGLPDPPRPLHVARDRAERADWYVDVDGLEGPWPSRTLEQSLAAVDAMGYTVVEADGVPAARKRGTDPRHCPVPFFIGPTTDRRRADVLAATLEQFALSAAIRSAATLDADRAAAYVGVPPTEVSDLFAEAQRLMRNGDPVPADRAGALGRAAAVLRSEFVLTGNPADAAHAARLERAAARVGLEEARTVAILAFAEELIDEPALLRAYGAAISGDDDATLVIVTRDPASLVDAVAAAGLGDARAADLLAVEAAPRGVDAVFSRRDYGGLPRFDERSLGALRELLAA